MASDSSESKPPQPSSLQSMLARLRGMVQALKTTDQEGEELLPTWDVMGSGTTRTGDALAPAAEPVSPEQALPLDSPDAAEAVPVAEPSGGEEHTTPPQAESPSSPAPQLCPLYQAPRIDQELSCADWRWI